MRRPDLTSEQAKSLDLACRVRQVCIERAAARDQETVDDREQWLSAIQACRTAGLSLTYVAAEMTLRGHQLTRQAIANTGRRRARQG